MSQISRSLCYNHADPYSWRAGGPNAAQNRSAAKGGASTSTSNNNTPQQRSRQLSASASTIPAEPVVPSLPTGNVWTNHARPPTTSVAKHSNPTAFISDTSNGAVIVKQQTSNISFNTDEVKEYFEQGMHCTSLTVLGIYAELC